MLFDEYEPLKEKMFQVMDYEGKIINSDWMPDISNDEILKAYKTMLLARVLDLKCVSLQRQGRVYTLPPNKGQEASAVGSAWALDDDDWLIPAYRELGAYLTRGLSIENYLWYWLGDERAFSKLKDIRMFPMSVPISSQLTHAVGLGYAINYKNKKEAVITYFGDGGSSKGDFHESVNFGAVFDTPVIFFCNNNQYAISYPRQKQTKTKTIAQKSIAYGIPGIQIDGNDFFAVYRATKEAVNYVKEGNGPVLIESVTYRQGAHTTSDDPSKYRTGEEEKEWEERDPLKRMKAYLMSQGLWDDDKEKEHNDKYNKQVEETFRKVEKYERQKIEDIFDYEYEEMPDSLKKQMMALKNFMSKKKEAK